MKVGTGVFVQCNNCNGVGWWNGNPTLQMGMMWIAPEPQVCPACDGTKKREIVRYVPDKLDKQAGP